MNRNLKILVAGYAIGFPLGGQLWMMLQYVLGLKRLGHTVLFLEDTSDWSYPYDPVRRSYDLGSSYGRRVLDDFFARCGLKGQWVYNAPIENAVYGMSREDLDRFCSQADLFLNISGITPLREEYLRCRVKAIIDTDPVFNQIKISNDEKSREYFQSHDFCFTFGWNLPDGVAGVPHSGIDWKSTLPPILPDLWVPLETPGGAFTTVGSWDSRGRDVLLHGRVLSWRKRPKYHQLLDLPRHLPGVDLELAFLGIEDDAKLFAEHGWVIRDAVEVSADPWRYRDYLRNSRGEFTVAKDQNVITRSGWFSDRSASYLAAGRPVITEDTGFGSYLPVGEGLFTYKTLEEAVQCIRAVEADPVRHFRAARRIAQEHFDAPKILSRILADAGLA